VPNPQTWHRSYLHACDRDWLLTNTLALSRLDVLCAMRSPLSRSCLLCPPQASLSGHRGVRGRSCGGNSARQSRNRFAALSPQERLPGPSIPRATAHPPRVSILYALHRDELTTDARRHFKTPQQALPPRFRHALASARDLRLYECSLSLFNNTSGPFHQSVTPPLPLCFSARKAFSLHLSMKHYTVNPQRFPSSTNPDLPQLSCQEKLLKKCSSMKLALCRHFSNCMSVHGSGHHLR
jgi:hypothetical protein